jgi:hypothetical protein
VVSTHSTLRVSRAFNEIVTPILFEDISLLTQTNDSIKFEKVLSWLFIPYARHIRSLHIWGDKSRSNPQDFEAWEECLVNFLRECIQLTTLSLYFEYDFSLSTFDMERRWFKLRDTVLFLITQGKLTSLVFYRCYLPIRGGGGFYEWNVDPILQAITESETARTRLKNLGLALSGSSVETWRLMRSNFPNLESLVIMKTFGGWWDYQWNPQIDQWSRCDSLTSLVIYGCRTIASSDVPQIILLFPALRELQVSALRAFESKSFRQRYPVGWHLLPSALCNTHHPIESMHIDILKLESIQFVGVIPTKTLTVGDIPPKTFVTALHEDMHLFPGMNTLRYKPSGAWKPVETVLNEWCTPRDVEVVKVGRDRHKQTSRKYKI